MLKCKIIDLCPSPYQMHLDGKLNKTGSDKLLIVFL